MADVDRTAAEQAAQYYWRELMGATSADERWEALDAAVEAFGDALAGRGVPVPDYLARVALLDRALGELDARLDAALPDTPTH